MPLWIQAGLNMLFILWLFAVLFILWLVWRKQVQRLATMEVSLMRDSKVSAQAAEKAAEAACMLAAQLQTKIIEGKTLSQ